MRTAEVIIMDDGEIYYNYKGILYTKEQFEELINDKN